MNRTRNSSRSLLACIAVMQLFLWAPRAGAAYASDFVLTNHITGEPTRLADLAGAVLVLDFFSAVCTSCRASAPDIRTNIVDYFRNAGGNADGIPVVVVSISEWTNNADTDPFIQTNGLELVLDDTVDHSVFKQFGGITYPHFVVVNGVTNGVNYPPWQILGTTFGYSSAGTVALLRNYINAVRGTVPPRLDNTSLDTNQVFRASFTAQRGRTNWVEASTNGVDWVSLGIAPGTNLVEFIDSDAAQFPQRFYRIRVQE